MASKAPKKSILKKKSKPSEPTEEEKAKADRDKHHLSIALNHAHRIELQKRIAAQILQNLITLIDLPTSPSTIDSKASDAKTFTTLVHPFQPSDFAALVEERRIASSCGYVLCPKTPRSETLGPSAAWKLKGGKAAGDFCSTECVRKALYVKAQLSETPAWERVEGQQAAVVLPEQDRVEGENDSVSATGGRQVANGRELAAERGEEATSFRPRQVMMDSVVEKKRSPSASAPAFPRLQTNGSYGAIEGYESRFSSKQSRDDEDDSDDGEEQDDNEVRPTPFSSEVRAEDDFDEEEEAAWREMQSALRQLNTGHDR